MLGVRLEQPCGSVLGIVSRDAPNRLRLARQRQATVLGRNGMAQSAVPEPNSTTVLSRSLTPSGIIFKIRRK